MQYYREKFSYDAINRFASHGEKWMFLSLHGTFLNREKATLPNTAQQEYRSVSSTAITFLDYIEICFQHCGKIPGENGKADLFLTQLSRNIAWENADLFQSLQDHSWRKFITVSSTEEKFLEKIQICFQHCRKIAWENEDLFITQLSRNVAWENADLFPVLQKCSWRKVMFCKQ